MLEQSESESESESKDVRTLDDLRTMVYEGLCNLAQWSWTLLPSSNPAARSTSKKPPTPHPHDPTSQPSTASALVHDPTTNQVWSVRPTQPTVAPTPLMVQSKRLRDTRAVSEGLAVHHARLLALSPSISGVTSRTFVPLTWVRSWRMSDDCTTAPPSVHAVVPDARLGMSAAEQLACSSLALP